MKHFREYCQIREDVSQKTKLFVFDFNGTVANTPTRSPQYVGKDWWGSKESLTSPLYNGEVNNNVVEAMRQAKADPNAKVVLLTGRRGVVAKHVRDILRTNNLYGKRVIGNNNKNSINHFQSEIASGHDINHPKEAGQDSHEEYYTQDFMYEPGYPVGNKGKPAGDTFSHKSYVISKLVKEGNFAEVILYDDRADHLQMFEQLLKNFLKAGLIQKATIHRVIENPGGVDATIIDIPVKI